MSESAGILIYFLELGKSYQYIMIMIKIFLEKNIMYSV